MDIKVGRNALSAWATLCDTGGLELNSRDADIADALRRALDASAATLEEALLASSTDDLIRAFLDLVQPFAQMFRSILEFFKSAGAREGRSAWVVQVDETHLDLIQFQQCLARWDALTCEIEVPAIDSTGALAVFDAAGRVGWNPYFGDGNAQPATGLADVDRWLEEYALGRYAPFPPSLLSARLSSELADATSILIATLGIIRRTWTDRATMLSEYRARHHSIDDGDGFSPRTIAQHETDDRVAHTIVCLALASRNEIQRREFSQALTRNYEKYPRRKMGIQAELPELERLLSLPLWQRRHEIYAVWIATEIVNALDDRDCQLHHDNGRITFAFREDLLATVHTSRPKVSLYTERRSPLTAPVGHTRKRNVQPDYGLWRGKGAEETCQLVIEVKHYKRGPLPDSETF